MIEPLEPRRHLSATVNGNWLHVAGSEGNDVITFRKAGQQITAIVNGTESTFDLATVRRIRVSGLGGDDLIIAGRRTLPFQIDGGAGNDTISGGRGSDILIGGDGADVISGLSGNDWIAPGPLHEDAGTNGDGAADNVRGGLGTDEMLIGDETDTNGGIEEISHDVQHRPVLIGFGDPRIFLNRRGSAVYAYISVTFPSSGYDMRVTDVARHGRTIQIHLDTHLSNGGVLTALMDGTLQVKLGRLREGPYTIKVIDRSNEVIERVRFAAPVAKAPIVTPEGTHMWTSRYEDITRVHVGIGSAAPGFRIHAGDVTRNGNTFELDVTVEDLLTGQEATVPNSGTSYQDTFSFDHLDPGEYTFTVTMNGRIIKTFTFTAPLPISV